MIDLADARVESANGAEAGSESNVAHRQTRFVDKFFREMQSARIANRTRSRAQVLEKQTSQVTRANSKSFRERFYTTLFETTLAD